MQAKPGGSRGRVAVAGRSDDQDCSRSVSPDKRRRLRAHKSDQSNGDGGRRREKDDAKRLSNKYKFLGKEWAHGRDCITPKEFRVSMIVGCDSDRYEQLTLMLLSEEQVDLLIFCLGGIPQT